MAESSGLSGSGLGLPSALGKSVVLSRLQKKSLVVLGKCGSSLAPRCLSSPGSHPCAPGVGVPSCGGVMAESPGVGGGPREGKVLFVCLFRFNLLKWCGDLLMKC